MPDAVQFSVTKRHNGTYKLVVQDEKEIIRTHILVDGAALFDYMEDEVNKLRPAHD